MSFQPRPSRAAQIWIAIIVVVLVALFLETQDSRQGAQNFFISTEQNGIGADVLIDHHKVGTIGSGESAGLGGGVFRTEVGSGLHTIEIQKNGFQPFAKQLEMHREAYLGVDLQPTTH